MSRLHRPTPLRPDSPGRLRETLAIVAHELHHDVSEVRTAATALDELIRRSYPEGELSATARHLITAVERLERSLPQLLQDPADLDELRLAPVRVAELVRQVIDAHEPKGHEVVRDLASVVVELDPLKLERIVDNLLVNALQHTPAGSQVTVSVAADPAGSIRLTVADDGPGLPEEARARIFEQDVTIHGDARGLAVVSHLARLHGGRAWAEPGQYGTGLRVHVDLPTGQRLRRQEPDRVR